MSETQKIEKIKFNLYLSSFKNEYEDLAFDLYMQQPLFTHKKICKIIDNRLGLNKSKLLNSARKWIGME